MTFGLRFFYLVATTCIVAVWQNKTGTLKVKNFCIYIWQILQTIYAKIEFASEEKKRISFIFLSSRVQHLMFWKEIHYMLGMQEESDLRNIVSAQQTVVKNFSIYL